MPTLCIKTIADLTKMSFFIPSYQRGYRWRDTQVKQLLNDLFDFYQDNRDNPEAWYCLQPLVVAQLDDNRPVTTWRSENVLPCGHTVSSGNSTQGAWTVIDGQQRVTTLFIILSQLGQKDAWLIEYETRDNSGEFLRHKLTPGLDSVSRQESASNPDFFCMQVAVDTVFEWIKSKELAVNDKRAFAECVLNNAKFIWYETAEEPYDVFIRLNSGKISLSNAELIKALLLRETRFQEEEGTVKLQQFEVAGEWDRIEQALGNDEFWYFINPDAESPRFNATRIDFLFELVLRKGIEGLDSIRDYLSKLEENPYLGFVKLADFCKSHLSEDPETVIWAEIQFVFRSIKSWYDDRSLYHYVGFLMNRKGKNSEKRSEERFGTLVYLLTKSESKKVRQDSNAQQTITRSVFKTTIKNMCSKAIKGVKKFDELDYSKREDMPKLNDVLLLFNLALLDRQSSEQSRYPFHLHTQKKWSLEHIHAQKTRTLKAEDIDRLKNIYHAKSTMTIEELNEALERDAGMKIEVKTLKLEFSDTSNDTDENEIVSGNVMLNSLSNLALLGGKENSALNDGMYLEKKTMLSEWERSLEKRFIPIGTRMAFFKHFSPASTMPFAWTVPDGNNYSEAIKTLVEGYLKPSTQTADYN